MTLAFTLRFILILLAMLAAAAGFVSARNQAERRTALQIAILSSEIRNIRRRTAHAGTEAERARNQLSQEKRRSRCG